MNESAQLLHNMSAPPKSVVTYTGLSGVRTPHGPGGLGVTVRPSAGQHQFGWAIRFTWPVALHKATPLAVLRYLGVAHDATVHGTPDQHLRTLVNQRADTLPLPEGCAVIRTDPDHPVVWPDLLAALAVLSKSTDTVWLRGKTPALAGAVQRTDVSVLIPSGLAIHIKELQG